MFTNSAKLIRKIGLISILMLWFSIASGVFYREFSKYELKNVSLGKSFFPVEFLQLLHGHILILGFIIPIGLAFFISILPEIDDNAYKKLNTAFNIYLIGTIGAIFLLFWKGIEYVRVYVHNPALTVEQIDKLIFSGNHVLRSSLYGIFHLLFGVGLIWFTIIIWNKLNRRLSNGI